MGNEQAKYQRVAFTHGVSLYSTDGQYIFDPNHEVEKEIKELKAEIKLLKRTVKALAYREQNFPVHEWVNDDINLAKFRYGNDLTKII